MKPINAMPFTEPHIALVVGFYSHVQDEENVPD